MVDPTQQTFPDEPPTGMRSIGSDTSGGGDGLTAVLSVSDEGVFFTASLLWSDVETSGNKDISESAKEIRDMIALLLESGSCEPGQCGLHIHLAVGEKLSCPLKVRARASKTITTENLKSILGNLVKQL